MENIFHIAQMMIGTSVESKPTSVPSGSEFRETDTGNVYIYNAATATWTIKKADTAYVCSMSETRGEEV